MGDISDEEISTFFKNFSDISVALVQVVRHKDNNTKLHTCQ